MAWISTEEYWENEAEGTSDAVRSTTRRFKVINDEIVDPLLVILNSPGLPLKWEPHPLDSTMIVDRGTAANLQGDPHVWMVVIYYHSRTNTEDRGAENPLDRPTEIETDFIAYQKPMVYDRFGKAVLNSANDPLDPFPQMEDSRFVVRFGRFEADFDPLRSLAYRNAVNTDSFAIGAAVFKPGEVMCMYIKQRRHVESTYVVYFTMYELQMKANGQVLSKGLMTPYQGWDAVVPDVGFNQITAAGIKKLITDEDGKAVSVPVRLDGFGGKMFPGNPREDTNFLIFNPDYRYLPFAPLALP